MNNAQDAYKRFYNNVNQSVIITIHLTTLLTFNSWISLFSV